MDRIIVSRHPAAIEFIRSNHMDFKDAPVLATATEEDVAHKIVAGNLPMHLACKAAYVYQVEFNGPAPRGIEYTIEDMTKAGARLQAYMVMKL